MTRDLEKLRTGRKWFEDLVRELGVERSVAPLGEGEWSVVQHMEHLFLAERGFVLGLLRAKEPLPTRTAEELAKREEAKARLASADRYPVPVPAAEPSESPNLDALQEDWDKLRQKLEARAAKSRLPGADVLVGVHPVFGALNGPETLEFLAMHLDYHQKVVTSLLAGQGESSSTPPMNS